MILWWRRKRKPLTQEEAVARAKHANELLNQKLADMKKAEEDVNNLSGPGGPDDSAGAVRVP